VCSSDLERQWLLPVADKIIYDVGGEYNADAQVFDHHQRPTPLRENGQPFSSFGLIWAHYGRTYLAAMDVATIKGVADRLRQKGLILAEPDPGDKRRTLISLSPEGTALVERMQAVGHAITAETLKPLSPSEQRSLAKLLRKLA